MFDKLEILHCWIMGEEMWWNTAKQSIDEKSRNIGEKE